MMRIKAQRIRDAGALTTYIGNSIFILENSDSGENSCCRFGVNLLLFWS